MRVLYNMRRFSARNVSNRTKENKSAEPSKMVYFYVKLKKKQETGITCFTDGFFWLEKSALAEYLDFTERVESGFIRERIK